METALAYHEPLASWISPVPQRRLPSALPLGFPEQFRQRLLALAANPQVDDEAFEHLYFDLVLCPQVHARIRRMLDGGIGASAQPASEAIFLDPAFNWQHHLDERLNLRWRECLIRHGSDKQLSEELALLSGFRVLAEHLD